MPAFVDNVQIKNTTEVAIILAITPDRSWCHPERKRRFVFWKRRFVLLGEASEK